jgi:hypothetical protein
VTDRYSKLAEDVVFRQEVAEKVGTGFAVPIYEPTPMRPMRPRKPEKREVSVAA